MDSLLCTLCWTTHKLKAISLMTCTAGIITTKSNDFPINVCYCAIIAMNNSICKMLPVLLLTMQVKVNQHYERVMFDVKNIVSIPESYIDSFPWNHFHIYETLLIHCLIEYNLWMIKYKSDWYFNTLKDYVSKFPI